MRSRRGKILNGRARGVGKSVVESASEAVVESWRKTEEKQTVSCRGVCSEAIRDAGDGLRSPPQTKPRLREPLHRHAYRPADKPRSTEEDVWISDIAFRPKYSIYYDEPRSYREKKSPSVVEIPKDTISSQTIHPSINLGSPVTQCSTIFLQHLNVVYYHSRGNGRHLEERDALAHGLRSEQADLAHQDQCERDAQGQLDHEDLDKHLHETSTGGPVEALPCLEEADLAATAQNGRDDLPTKGAVKWHNGLVFLGEHRRCNADKGHVGRHLNQHSQSQERNENANAGTDHLSDRHIRSETVADCSHYRQGQVECDLGGRHAQSHSGCDLCPALATGDALVERLRGRLRDDDVDPGHLQVGQKDFSKNPGGGAAEKPCMNQGDFQQANHHGASDCPSNVHLQATESSPTAGAGSEVTDRGAQLARDRFGRGERHSGLVCSAFGIILVQVDADIEIRVGVLDSGESGYDHAISVLNLQHRELVCCSQVMPVEGDSRLHRRARRQNR